MDYDHEINGWPALSMQQLYGTLIGFPIHFGNVNKIMAVDPAEYGPWDLLPIFFNYVPFSTTDIPADGILIDVSINIDGMLCNGMCI